MNGTVSSINDSITDHNHLHKERFIAGLISTCFIKYSFILSTLLYTRISYGNITDSLLDMACAGPYSRQIHEHHQIFNVVINRGQHEINVLLPTNDNWQLSEYTELDSLL